MALSRPLRLRAEIAKKNPEQSSSREPIARVWVDSGIFHCDQIYDYRIPDNLSSQISIGVRLQVPFNGREVEAIVLSRAESSEQIGLKAVSKVLSPHSVASADSLELIAAVANRWAAHPFDILRSAIPPRVASVDKENWIVSSVTKVNFRAKRSYVHIPPVINHFEFLRKIIMESVSKGSTLVILPDSRSVKKLHKLLPQGIVLDSTLERSERYRNFLTARFGNNLITIGTRSAIFSPIADLDSIIIFDEGSQLHYEARSPGWNVRDVAILRSLNSRCSLTFVGYSPSSETSRLIESRWLEFSATKSRIQISAYPQEHGELLPSRLVSEVRKALRIGTVLFVGPQKGYSQAVICSKCRNFTLCHCGGKMLKKSAVSPLECDICAKEQSDWNCSWCHGKVPYLIGRGNDRFVYEIGATFPGINIVQSNSENFLEVFNGDSGMVVATPGAIPDNERGYSLVVILEGERFLAQADLRAQERVREIFFSTAARASDKGRIALVAAENSPIVGAIAAWKPSLLAQRELRERQETHLPPYSRAVTMDIDISESASLLRALKKAQSDGRLPQSTNILGPSKFTRDLARFVLLTPFSDGEALVSLLHEFQRRRSAAKKTLASIRIDPYSLSR